MGILGRSHFLALYLIFALPSLTSTAMELEFVSNEAIRGLADEFEGAQANSSQLDLSGVWTCDLYGAQSRLQVKRDVLLYQFSPEQAGALGNGGAHPVKSYSLKSIGSLKTYVGSQDGLQDEIRIGSSGGLVTRLSTLSGGQKIRVIAFSRCRKKV